MGGVEFTRRELQARIGAFKLSYRFVQFDLVGGRIDLEKKVTFMDDIPVLEADLSQGSADLRAQLNALDSGELPQKLASCIQIMRQRCADRHYGRRRDAVCYGVSRHFLCRKSKQDQS